MITFKHNIRKEFESYAKDAIQDGVITFDNQDDWHYHLFNKDHYIIGYYNASQWLKKYNIDAFEAIAFIQEYENDMFGECKIYDNSESTVNMLAYILGEQWLSEEYAQEFIKLNLKGVCNV